MSSLSECYGSPHEFFESDVEYLKGKFPDCEIKFHKDPSEDHQRYVYYWITVKIPKDSKVTVRKVNKEVKELEDDFSHMLVKRDWNCYCKFVVTKI